MTVGFLINREQFNGLIALSCLLLHTTMDVYFVKPNLEISNCENCPNQTTLVSKKAHYLSLLKKCTQLSELNGGDSQIPNWCNHISTKEDDDTDDEIDEEVDDNDKNNDNNNENDDEEILVLPIQSFNPTVTDYTKPIDKENAPSVLYKLQIPTKPTPMDGKWLALKYLQITSDIALVRYKYLKSYTKVNKLVCKYFSKPDLSLAEEQKGTQVVDTEMKRFRELENLLNLLLELKKQFEGTFHNFK